MQIPCLLAEASLVFSCKGLSYFIIVDNQSVQLCMHFWLQECEKSLSFSKTDQRHGVNWAICVIRVS